MPGAESHRIERYDWWSALIQFVGTLLFNVSTFAAVLANLDAEQANRWVWRPDIWGSLAFLISSGLAVVATTDTDRLWDPHARNWRTTWLNMLGSVAFGVSALAAWVDPSSGTVANARIANLGTFVGAICFLVAALLAKPPAPRR